MFQLLNDYTAVVVTMDAGGTLDGLSEGHPVTEIGLHNGEPIVVKVDKERILFFDPNDAYDGSFVKSQFRELAFVKNSNFVAIYAPKLSGDTDDEDRPS